MRKLLTLTLILTLLGSLAQARDWYISAELGRGRDGTIEQPSRDLGVVLSLLEAGDRIFIAHGEYLGRAGNGSDRITVPVEIFGGWNDDFTVRDPWGEFKTVLSGDNASDNFVTDTRLSIDTSDFSTNLNPVEHLVLVDGVIIDNGARNYYSGDEGLRIVRQGTSSNNPTPESGGLVITTGQFGEVIVQNVVVMNTAPTQGAFAFFPGKGGRLTIDNNVAANNTGIGFHLSRSFFANDAADFPTYTFSNNISVFNEKHDPIATYGGSAIKLEAGIAATIEGNVFAMNDYYGVDNAGRAADVVLTGNLFMGNLVADYLEFDTKIELIDIEDFAELLADAGDNRSELVALPIDAAWGEAYMARNIIDRAEAEEGVGALNSDANALRSILGLNLQGSDISIDSAVWLPRLTVEQAFGVVGRYFDSFGTFRPAPFVRE
jgi:hypothetical protein